VTYQLPHFLGRLRTRNAVPQGQLGRKVLGGVDVLAADRPRRRADRPDLKV
jgi:hypothetical protein